MAAEYVIPPLNPIDSQLIRTAPRPECCVVLVPVQQNIVPSCERSLRELETLGYPVRRIWGVEDIDVSRSQIATEALRDGFDELVWIDSDMAFDVASIARLRSHGVPIVCGLYAEKGQRALACQVLPETRNIEFEPNANLTEVQYARFGFMLTRRSAYEAIQHQHHLPECDSPRARPFVPYFMPLLQPGPQGPWYLSADYAFCERARRSGLAIMADPAIRLWHIGMKPVSWEEVGGNQRRYTRYRFQIS